MSLYRCLNKRPACLCIGWALHVDAASSGPQRASRKGRRDVENTPQYVTHSTGTRSSHTDYVQIIHNRPPDWEISPSSETINNVQQKCSRITCGGHRSSSVPNSHQPVQRPPPMCNIRRLSAVYPLNLLITNLATSLLGT